jgi:tetratricopeptide (TPR) repeat protein
VKKETLITALVFLGIGFLAGYVYKAQSTQNVARETAPAPASAPMGQAAGAATTSESSAAGLPPGHPPIGNPAMRQMLEQQAAQNQQDPQAALKVADYLYDQGQFDQAIPWYQKSLQLDARNVNARTDMGTCYFNIGRPDDALREFRQSLAINPRHEPTLYNLVVVNLEGKHDLKAASRAWDDLQRLNPNYPSLDQLKQKLDQARASAPGGPGS